MDIRNPKICIIGVRGPKLGVRGRRYRGQRSKIGGSEVAVIGVRGRKLGGQRSFFFVEQRCGSMAAAVRGPIAEYGLNKKVL